VTRNFRRLSNAFWVHRDIDRRRYLQAKSLGSAALLMDTFDADIAEGAKNHLLDARKRLGADLSHEIHSGAHFVSWHTPAGYAFLNEQGRKNLMLWHAVFDGETARTRVAVLLGEARAAGLSIYNDIPLWKRLLRIPRPRNT